MSKQYSNIFNIWKLCQSRFLNLKMYSFLVPKRNILVHNNVILLKEYAVKLLLLACYLKLANLAEYIYIMYTDSVKMPDKIADKKW